jgi:hypothetical protein
VCVWVGRGGGRARPGMGPRHFHIELHTTCLNTRTLKQVDAHVKKLRKDQTEKRAAVDKARNEQQQFSRRCVRACVLF